jgi:cyanophycinase
MFRKTMTVVILAAAIFSVSLINSADNKPQYFRAGNKDDVSTKTQFGVALMGGGSDLDEAFQWMCRKSGGGDFLVIRATGGDDYDPYIAKLCKQNSVATLVIPDKQTAEDPTTAEIISKAEALFIAGGDQSNYVKYWKDTPVEDAINQLIRRGVPVGGTSAGLAVLGQFIFTAMNDSAYSKETLADPYNDRVTIGTDFLKVPHMQNVITDTHFAKRDRQGRLLGFMARIVQDGSSQQIRAIGMDERSAGLMDADGKVRIVGPGQGGYFYRPGKAPEVCARGKPLTYRGISVYKAPSGATFDLSTWSGQGGSAYELNVLEGVASTNQAGGKTY